MIMLHQNTVTFEKKCMITDLPGVFTRLSSLTDQIFIKAQRIKGFKKIQFKKLTKVKLMSLSALLIIQ